MKLSIDQNNLIVIENPNIPQTKEYCYNVSGYEFCDFDKGLIIYHKKQFKIINLKDFGDKMGVFMVGKQDSKLLNKKLDISSMENALRLFEGFNEDTGEKYNFLYKFAEAKIEDLNNKLKVLGSDIEFTKTNKGIITLVDDKDEEEISAIDFLFGLTLIYGNLNIKNNDLKSIKIQIPLFGTNRDKSELLDIIVSDISAQNIFLKTNIQETNDGIIYQITSSDFELLKIFASFYEPIEKGLEISKYTDTLKIKEKLIEFLNTNKEIPNEGKSEVLNELKSGIIKILVK